jgi:hypothetical protein
MFQDYLVEIDAAHADLTGVLRSLAGRDAVGEPFHYASLVAEWGLAHFENERRSTLRTIARLRREHGLPLEDDADEQSVHETDDGDLA